MSKKRRPSDDFFLSPIDHLSAEDVRGLFNNNDNDLLNRYCSFCNNPFKIGTSIKTTSTLRTHLKTKHSQEVLKKYPKPMLAILPILDKPTNKIPKFFDPVQLIQQKYDRACLMRFIADGESYSSLKSKGIFIFSSDSFFSINLIGNILFHQTMFPELIMPNKTLIKTGLRNLWNNILKPKLEEYISTEASDSDITSTLDIWSDDTNQSFLGVTIHFLTKLWILESFSIALKPLSDAHTADNIASWLNEVYVQWKIRPWLRLNDGASNVSEALSRSLEKLAQSTCYLRCGAHKLHGVCKGLSIESYVSPIILNHMKINNHISRR